MGAMIVAYAPIVISALSLVVATVSFVMNYRLNKRDKERSEQLAEMQMRLHELQLMKEEEAAKQRASSRVEAHYVKIGLKDHRIRVSNTGGTIVTNVTCEYDENNGPYAVIQDKEPFERLEPGESFDETFLFADRSPSKFTVVTRWHGADGEEHRRENIVSR